MKANELREKSESELRTLLLTLRRQQARLRIQNNTAAGDQKKELHKIRLCRKTIARLKTLMNENQKRGSIA